MAGPARSLVPALRSLLVNARSDADLLQRFVAVRDEGAFAELVSRHGAMVLGVSRRVTRDAHAAEDVFQATFLLLARKAEAIRRPEALGAWLHQTAFRLALRARRAGGVSPLFERVNQQGANAPRSPESALDALTVREMLGVLDEELARLPEEQRLAVVLCCLEGLSLEEAARRLGCTAGSVKGRLERGRARLRQRLERRGLTLSAALAAPLLDAAPARALVEAALAAALRDEVGASVLALINGGMSAMSITKLTLGCAVILLAGVAGLAAALRDEQPPADKETAAVAELPPGGARLRLGGMERRAAGAKFAVSADGKTLVVVHRRSEKAITEYDAVTGKMRVQRNIPQEHLSGLWQLSPGGRWLATSEQGGGAFRLNVWDVATGKRVRQLTVNGSWMIPRGDFSADGTRLAALSYEAMKRRVFVWDWKGGTEVASVVADGQDECHQVALSPDGKHALLLMGAANKGIHCWEVASGKLLWTTKGIASAGVLVTPAGKVLSGEGTGVGPLVERDLLTGEKTNTLRLPLIAEMPYTALTPDGKHLVESGPKFVNVWNLATGKNLVRFGGGWSEVAVTPDGKSVVTNDGSLQRWDMATGKPAYADETAKGHLDEVTRMVFSADGKRLASASNDGSVAVWDTASGKPLNLRRSHYARRPHPHGRSVSYGGVGALDMTADGRWVASADNADAFRVFDTVSGKQYSFRQAGGRGAGWHGSVLRFRLDPDGRAVTGVYRSETLDNARKFPGRLMRWDVATGKATALAEVADPAPWAGDLDRAGRFFINAARLHDAATGKPLVELAGCDAQADASLSPDGMLVAGGPTRRDWNLHGLAKTPVRVWETATGKVIAELKVVLIPGDKVFHPGGRILAWDDHDDGIRAWDLRSGKMVKHWPIPEELSINGGAYRVSCFAFSPDGKTLATGHPDGTILLWDADLPSAKPEPIRPNELDALWRDLGGEDAPKAYRAAWRLAELPRETLGFLRDRVKPATPAPAETTRALIAGLDADAKASRDQAQGDLHKLGHRAEPAMREALKASASAEQKRRLEQLLAALDRPGALTAEQIRDLRAVLVLGWIDTPESTKVLRSLSDGMASDLVTKQAKTALRRR